MACACISVQLRKHCSAAVQLPKLFHRGCWATFEAACALLFVLVMDADKYGPCPLPMPQLLGLGPYWVKGGKAPPAPLFTQAETVGALPTALQLQPLEEVDTWASWPRLQCALTDTPKRGPPVPASPCQPPPGVGAWKMCAKGDSDTDTESETSSSSLSSSDEESCDDAASLCRGSPRGRRDQGLLAEPYEPLLPRCCVHRWRTQTCLCPIEGTGTTTLGVPGAGPM